MGHAGCYWCGVAGTCSMFGITVAGLGVLECTVSDVLSGTAVLVCSIGDGLAGAKGLVIIETGKVGEDFFVCWARGFQWGIRLGSGYAAWFVWAAQADDGWTGLLGRLRVTAASGYTDTLGHSAVLEGTAVLGTAAQGTATSKDAVSVYDYRPWLVRALTTVLGCSADFNQVYGLDILMGLPVLFSLDFNHIAQKGCCLGHEVTGDVCSGLSWR